MQSIPTYKIKKFDSGNPRSKYDNPYIQLLCIVSLSGLLTAERAQLEEEVCNCW